jgi:hypothetical protein
MRARHLLLAGGLALFLAACSKNSHLPPPLNKQLLPGKWKNAAERQLITGCEFAEDGTMKMSIDGMDQPMSGRYSWSGEHSLDLEYPREEDVRKAYAAAVKAYKDRFMERVNAGAMPATAASSLKAIHDELPDKETFRVAIGEKPQVQLFLTDDKGTSRNFLKAD